MSFYNPGINTNEGAGFYQPNTPFQVPQGSMSFSQQPAPGQAFSQEPLPTGLLNALSTKGYPHELPLLEEIGINFSHILSKTKMVLTPLQRADSLPFEVIADCDLAGPLIFCLLFGTLLLVAGKVHFGYIYGVALFGTVSLHTLLKLMGNNNSTNSADGAHRQSDQLFLRTASILGYCFLPLCLLSLVGVFVSLNNVLGYTLALFLYAGVRGPPPGFSLLPCIYTTPESLLPTHCPSFTVSLHLWRYSFESVYTTK
ncbi:LAME_0C02234g1_1 [Lachancea meyersii CBS 8951]|uniref:LAME_0C02234g1_1 n=1 Tax=Lachancea meyersii CBS 8951 TaxID=1266667 RepID=A0A1G4IZQ1_9SACH|nr:LAME_0C02234g1_1 [Lachancea meyersii CBS 8951]